VSRPWQAEHSVSAQRAAALIDEQFAELRPARAAALGVGWDNSAFLVNDEWVFRFPRRAIAVPLVETEARVLPSLAPRLPLPIPVPRFVGAPSGEYPWPFVGHRMIAGRTADGTRCDRAVAAEPLARFLRALHDVPVEEARSWGAGPDTLARLDPSTRLPRLRERLADLVAARVIADAGPWEPILDGATLPEGPPALVHGDLYGRHVLVDDRGAPCGVIDWGDVHVGHPAVDVSVACSMLPPAAYAAFRAAYGPIEDAWWRAARFKALFTAVAIVLYGRDVGDASLVAEGTRTMEWLTLQ
jgi:aminoglycoside phosphotransferase (APT) family kinase protein